MSKKLLPIPEFKTEDEEFEFWSSHDTSDYIDWSLGVDVEFSKLEFTKDLDMIFNEALVMRDVERVAEATHTSKRALILKYLVDGVRREGLGLGVRQAA